MNTQTGGGRYLAVALVVTTLVWIPLFIVRIHAHQPNVDDYLYAAMARHAFSGDFIGNFLDSGQNAPLVPTLAAPGAELAGLNGAFAVELPILLVLVTGTFLLARTWLSARGAMVTALIVGLNEAVLGYAVMINFSLASTAGVVWCFTAYLRSRRLSDLRWSVGLGVATGALLLSRSIVPLYVAPLALVVVVDLVLDARRNGHHFGRPAVVAVGIVVVMAGPWWLASGPTAVHYLLDAGYQPTSGYTSQGFQLTPASVLQRAGWELAWLGWIQSLVLGVAVVAALGVVVVRRRHLRIASLWMLAAWSVATFLILSTSSNQGTGFGVPVLVVVMIACAAVLGQLPRSALRAMVIVVVPVLAVGVGAQASSSANLWWPGPPYRLDLQSGGGTVRTNIEQLTSQVVGAVGGARVLVARDDSVLNVNGLRWYSEHPDRIENPPTGPDGTRLSEQRLDKVTMLITGDSPLTFDPNVNRPALEEVAVRDGFRPVREWKVGRESTVVLWQHGGTSASLATQAPVTRVLHPGSGHTVHGSTFLIASASDQVGVARVEFRITGPGLAHPEVIPAGSFSYGWLAAWDTTTVANGTYTVVSAATSLQKKTGVSAGVVVHVHN